MKVLVGVDVQPIEEVTSSIEEFGARYTKRIFTDHELANCGDVPETAAKFLAARFAAKEAVLKVLDLAEEIPRWRDIEIRRSPTGRPQVYLSGVALEIALRQGVCDWSLSLSHGGGCATAAVVAQASDDSEGVAP